jgi:stress response protein YsnF
MEEELIVEKRPIVKGELVVGKRVIDERDVVEAEVRKSTSTLMIRKRGIVSARRAAARGDRHDGHRCCQEELSGVALADHRALGPSHLVLSIPSEHRREI